jgi:hypothetical protein
MKLPISARTRRQHSLLLAVGPTSRDTLCGKALWRADYTASNAEVLFDFDPFGTLICSSAPIAELKVWMCPFATKSGFMGKPISNDGATGYSFRMLVFAAKD